MVKLYILLILTKFNYREVKKMVEAYCVKCKKKQEMKNAEDVTMKNGRKAKKGKCPACGCGMYRIGG